MMSLPRHNNQAFRVTVGVASTQILPAASDRDPIWIENISDTTIYIQVGTAATVAAGMPLAPGAAREYHTLRPVYGISPLAGKEVACLEGKGQYVGAGGGGGAASGSIAGSANYSVAQKDFTAARSGADNLTLTFPAGFFTVTVQEITKVMVRDSTGKEIVYDPESNPFVWTVGTGVLQVVGGAFAVGDLAYDVEITGPPRTSAANAVRTTATLVQPTQHIGADGTVQPSGSLVTNPQFVRLSNGTVEPAVDAANTARAVGTVVQAVQHVDSAGKVLPSGVSAAETIHTTVDNASLAVTGTFWQATQPVSLAADVGIADVSAADTARTTATEVLPVQHVDSVGKVQPSGASAAETIHTTLDNASVAVTGTFWQATQPVSLAADVGIADVSAANAARTTATEVLPVQHVDAAGKVQPSGASAAETIHTTLDNASVAVTGTFWQATQPVSLAADVGIADLSAANAARTTATEVLPVQFVDQAGLVPSETTDSYRWIRSVVDPAGLISMRQGDFAVTRTSDLILTLSGLSQTPSSVDQLIGVVGGAGGLVTEVLTLRSGPAVTWDSTALTLTRASGAWPANIMGMSWAVARRAYSVASNCDLISEVSPVNQSVLSEELVDAVDQAATTYYLPSSDGFSMSSYRDVSFAYVNSGGVTMTIEATIDDSATPDWLDITKAGYELVTNTAGAASYVDSSGILDFENLNVNSVRVKLVTSDASNGLQVHMRRKAL